MNNNDEKKKIFKHGYDLGSLGGGGGNAPLLQ